MVRQMPYPNFETIRNYKNWPKQLEPVCSKKQQKKVPDQLLVCGVRDPEDSEWYKIDPG